MCPRVRDMRVTCVRGHQGRHPEKVGFFLGVSTASTSVRNGLHLPYLPASGRGGIARPGAQQQNERRRRGAEPSQEQGCSGALAAGGRGVEGGWPGDQSLCALGSELAEQQQETKALLWELERGASSCPLQSRDLDVGKERLHKSPFRELAEKDVPSCRQSSHPRVQVCRQAWGWIWVLSSQFPPTPRRTPSGNAQPALNSQRPCIQKPEGCFMLIPVPLPWWLSW